jgi:hypothetical protein
LYFFTYPIRNGSKDSTRLRAVHDLIRAWTNNKVVQLRPDQLTYRNLKRTRPVLTADSSFWYKHALTLVRNFSVHITPGLNRHLCRSSVYEGRPHPKRVAHNNYCAASVNTTSIHQVYEPKTAFTTAELIGGITSSFILPRSILALLMHLCMFPVD